jgi:hypothetical protein
MRLASRRWRLVPVALVALALAAAGAFAHGYLVGADVTYAISGSVDPSEFSPFAIYLPGARVEGQRLSSVRRQNEQPSAGVAAGSYVALSAAYGACLPDLGIGGAPCVPQLRIEVAPACLVEASSSVFALHRTGAVTSQPYRRLTVDGVPAADFAESAGSHRLVLYAGRVTITIQDYGHDSGRFTVARRLVPVNALARRVGTPAGRLPAPTPGAVLGHVSCTAAERSFEITGGANGHS